MEGAWDGAGTAKAQFLGQAGQAEGKDGEGAGWDPYLKLDLAW